MNELDDLFQERLEHLEAGAPLETCAFGLPDAEVEMLRLAAALRQVKYPARDRQMVNTQRARLLSLGTQEGYTGSRQSLRKAAQQSWPGWLRLRPEAQPEGARHGWLKWAGAAALLFVCAFVAFAGLVLLRPPAKDAPLIGQPMPTLTSGSAVVQRPTPDPTAQIPSPVPVADSTHTLFMPLVAGAVNPHPQTAVLQEARGVVQIQAGDGAWVTAGAGRTLGAGQNLRTGALSGATLEFFDGSRVVLGPDSQVSIDELDARASDGPRVVALTQWAGETTHTVKAAHTAGSRYEVRTPSATGVAKGTTFHVWVAADRLTRFSVDEGAVAVTAQGATVSIAAGQVTTVQSDEAPDEPAFRISGEGEVTQTGAIWIIAGQSFETHAGTLIAGDAQVGDWVYVEGRLLADDTRIADRIALLFRSPANRFAITGPVEAIDDAEWTVAGQAIEVDDETVRLSAHDEAEIEAGIEIGDLARVEGVILESGALRAESIRRINDRPGLPFDFVGVIQNLGDEAWTVSGVVITLDDETEMDASLAVGDVVRVRGWILEDGSWLARSIHRVEDQERVFEITGQVESIDPWIVAGISFETREWTEIEPGIQVGDRVRVRGRILQDGAWVATQIERLADGEPVLEIVFVGTVDSIDPWVVNGLPLVVDGETVIEGDVGVGDLVRVRVSIMPDGSTELAEVGTWRATRITLIRNGEDGVGCLQIVAVVVGLDGEQLELRGWPTVYLDGDVPVEGEMRVGSVILIFACVDADGTIHIVRIVVLYSPEPEATPTPPAPPPPPPDDDDDEGGGKVTICHRPPGNPNAAHTLTIDRSALETHLGHGDTLGPCDEHGHGRRR